MKAASFAKTTTGLERGGHNGGDGPVEHGGLGLLLPSWVANLRAEPALVPSELHL